MRERDASVMQGVLQLRDAPLVTLELDPQSVEVTSQVPVADDRRPQDRTAGCHHGSEQGRERADSAVRP
jgi:hypothetical protein